MDLLYNFLKNKPGTFISQDTILQNPSTYAHPFEETPRYLVPKGFV